MTTNAKNLVSDENDFTHDATDARRFELSHGGEIVIDHKLQVMWAANELDRCDYAAAESACASFRLGDFNDWRLPDESELSSVRHLTKYNPCIDTAFFKSNGGWTWTRTPCAWSSDYVWIVHFGSGGVSDNHRDYEAFVRPVRSLPKRDSEGLGERGRLSEVTDGKVARDAEPTAADLAELSQIAVDFDDCEETQASDQTLHRLVSLGLLECIRYDITAKGRAAIKEQRG